MIIELESANEYYLAPLSNSESLHLIGGKDMMNYMAAIMKEGEIMATTGVEDEVCILIVPWSDRKCKRKIKEARDLAEGKKELTTIQEVQE
jgi:hypothetical protein